MKPDAGQRPAPRTGLESTMPILLAGPVTLVTAFCTIRMATLHMLSTATALLTIPVVFGLCFTLHLVIVRSGTRSRREDRPPQTVLLAGLTVLLAILGLLTRVTLGESGRHLMDESVTGAFSIVGAACCVAAAQVRRSGPGRDLTVLAGLVLAAGILVLFVVEYRERPGSAASHAGWTPMPDSVLPLLALLVPSAVTALLYVEPTGGSTLWGFLPLLRRLRAITRISALAALTPALMVFAFSHDLASAIPVLAAGVAVWATASLGKARPSAVILAVAAFAVGVAVIAGVGLAAGAPAFGAGVLFGRDGDGPGPLVGAHFLWGSLSDGRAVGAAGNDSQIVSVMARETGVMGFLGLLLLIVMFLLLLGWHARRAERIVDRATSLGLTGFLGAQFAFPLLALLRLPTAGVHPALLSNSYTWFLADVMAVAMVTGLAWRSTPKPSTAFVPETDHETHQTVGQFV